MPVPTGMVSTTGLQAATLRHRITIQNLNPSPDPFNVADGWTDVITMWASVQALSGKEVYEAGALDMKVSHKVTIRHPGRNYSVKAGNRIKFKNRLFELQTGIMNPDERNIMLVLLAYELDPSR